MDNEFLNSLFDQLKFDNQCLLYQGNFSNELMTKIIGLSEVNQKQYNEEFKTQRRISYLMAECFQNIMKHGEKDDSDVLANESSFFMNRNSMGRHYILSANLISHENESILRENIDLLNRMSKDELKLLYKKTIKEGQISDKGGAGLGLIDMARKSGYKLDYAFVGLNNESSVFYNQIVIDSGTAEEEIKDEQKLGVEPGIEFHKMLTVENILMVQKGDFSQDSLLPVLTIIEKSILTQKSKSSLMKDIYKVMVELLQNISKHAIEINRKHEGIFSLAVKNGHFIISTGNYVFNEDVDNIKSHVNKVNGLNVEELEDFYAETLMSNVDNDSECAGLGIITMGQIASENIKCDFSKVDDEKSFFCIHIVV